MRKWITAITICCLASIWCFQTHTVQELRGPHWKLPALPVTPGQRSKPWCSRDMCHRQQKCSDGQQGMAMRRLLQPPPGPGCGGQARGLPGPAPTWSSRGAAAAHSRWNWQQVCTVLTESSTVTEGKICC